MAQADTEHTVEHLLKMLDNRHQRAIYFANERGPGSDEVRSELMVMGRVLDVLLEHPDVTSTLEQVEPGEGGAHPAYSYLGVWWSLMLQATLSRHEDATYLGLTRLMLDPPEGFSWGESEASPEAD